MYYAVHYKYIQKPQRVCLTWKHTIKIANITNGGWKPSQLTVYEAGFSPSPPEKKNISALSGASA